MKELIWFKGLSDSLGLLLIYTATTFAFVPDAAGADTSTTSNVCAEGYPLLDGWQNSSYGPDGSCKVSSSTKDNFQQSGVLRVRPFRTYSTD